MTRSGRPASRRRPRLCPILYEDGEPFLVFLYSWIPDRASLVRNDKKGTATRFRSRMTTRFVINFLPPFLQQSRPRNALFQFPPVPAEPCNICLQQDHIARKNGSRKGVRKDWEPFRESFLNVHYRQWRSSRMGGTRSNRAYRGAADWQISFSHPTSPQFYPRTSPRPFALLRQPPPNHE